MSESNLKPLPLPRAIRVGSLSIGFMIRQLLENGSPAGTRNLHPSVDLKSRLGWSFMAQCVMRFGGETDKIAIQQRIKAGKIEFIVPIALRYVGISRIFRR